ncbi:DUF3164 family protein [uncultured Shewanella sp.]|uniref:DUF3164 family protein n=1 Tax=uncultured Shewanella sp. TaxID=173975 RepID=UPI00260721A8|nr:DUF3164 family protein [uncultured Shewanella sp.]
MNNIENQATQETQTPSGFRKNALGHLVPESQIKPLELIRDDLVHNIVQQAQALRETMQGFKQQAQQQLTDFVDLSASEYGVKYGGSKGNVVLTSFDGRYQVRRAIGEHRVFDERIQTAKALIDECIHSWSGGADDRLMAMVDHAFRVDQQGRINVNQVLSLRQLNIDDAKWLTAMEAIADAIQVTGTCEYLRLYERKNNGKYQQLPLDISSL